MSLHEVAQFDYQGLIQRMVFVPTGLVSASCQSLSMWCRIAPVAVLVVLLLGMAGCNQSKHVTSSDVVTIDKTRLYWCIEQIDSGRIHRGMDAGSLKELFGESLKFVHEGLAFSDLSLPAEGPKMGIPEGSIPDQVPPPWRIWFTTNSQGFVTKFSLTKLGGK